jgi:hypothetical protein
LNLNPTPQRQMTAGEKETAKLVKAAEREAVKVTH